MTDTIPAVVVALAASQPQLGPNPPTPIAWRETSTGWVIVFEDGRKLTFENVSRDPTARNGDVRSKSKKSRSADS